MQRAASEASPSAPLEPTAAELIAARPALSRDALDGLLFEGVPLAAIAREVATPTYVYSAAVMRGRYRALADALQAAQLRARIAYAVKANDHLAVLRLFGALGAGADVVSEGEIARARVAGIPAEGIVFSGVGKTDRELVAAIDVGVGQINIESEAELDALSGLAAARGRRVAVAFRVNPDIDAGTHAKITTGLARNKFGIPASEIPRLYARASALPGVVPVGLAVHIGSQIFSIGPLRRGFACLASLAREVRAAGFSLTRLDCGGGLGVGYANEPAPLPAALAGALGATVRELDVEVVLEPGRWLVAPAGVLLASVVRIKRGPDHAFIVLDAGMNDFLRPALYDAWHGIVPLAPRRPGESVPADVVGPICESADRFAADRLLSPLGPGDHVAILDTGAYGRVMGSAYNARPAAAEVMVSGSCWALIRRRPALASLWSDEEIPRWL